MLHDVIRIEGLEAVLFAARYVPSRGSVIDGAWACVRGEDRPRRAEQDDGSDEGDPHDADEGSPP
jgi:hypothetical protein